MPSPTSRSTHGTSVYQPEEFPDRLPKERRFFHYFHKIDRKLGVKGAANRAKLPACVREKIAEMYPDTEGVG